MSGPTHLLGQKGGRADPSPGTKLFRVKNKFDIKVNSKPSLIIAKHPSQNNTGSSRGFLSSLPKYTQISKVIVFFYESMFKIIALKQNYIVSDIQLPNPVLNKLFLVYVDYFGVFVSFHSRIKTHKLQFFTFSYFVLRSYLDRSQSRTAELQLL